MELRRVANASTYVSFPMVNLGGLTISGLTLTGTWAAWADTAGLSTGGNPGFRTLSGAFPEIAATGVYGGFLANTELPTASPYVLLRFTGTNAATQYLFITTASAEANVVGWRGSTPNVLVSGRMDADVAVLQTGVISSTTFSAGALDASAIAANAIGASELATDAGAEIADAVWDEVITSGHGTDNTSGLTLARLYHATQYLTGASDYADSFLGRTLTRGASGGRTVGQALMALRNRLNIAAGTLTVYSTDDTTAEWTATVATEAVSAIVTDINPA